MRKLLAASVASVIVGVGGLSLAGGGGPEVPVKVTQFQATESVLHGTIPGGALAEFAITEETRLLPGHGPVLLPPGPCRVIAEEWNSLASHGRLRLPLARLFLEVAANFKCTYAVGVPTTNPSGGGDTATAQSVHPE